MAAATICPRPSPPSVGAEAPPIASRRRAHRNVAVVSHDEYVPTLTAAAALRVKAALTFDLLTLKVVSESRVTWVPVYQI